MIRKLVLTASAVALAAGGLGLAGASTASAATTITAGAGSNLNCSITASVKLSPPLKDDYIQAQHSSDPNPDVVALPDHTYASSVVEHTTAKGTGTCTGSTAKQGSNSANITKVSFTLVSDPSNVADGEDTCVALAQGAIGEGPPSTATYDTTIKYTTNTPGFKVAGTTVTGASIGAGFKVTGGTITGSFHGGTSSTTNTADATTVGIVTQELSGPGGGPTVATSASPAAPNVCQSSLKIKTGSKHSASEKGPKGLKAIGIISPSTLTASA